MKKYVLLRVIGNELLPRDSQGSRISTLSFILKNEPAELCDKTWVLNHIIDDKYRDSIKNLLTKFNQHFVEIPFSPSEYLKLNNWSDKVRYAIYINQARNYGVKYCQKNYPFTFCMDQDCFFTEQLLSSAISRIEEDQDKNTTRKYYGIITKRILNGCLENIDLVPDQEPMVVFRYDATEYFNEQLCFGQADKVELLKRIGYRLLPKDYSVSGSECLTAGYVLHNSYGNALCERNLAVRVKMRKISLDWLVSNIDAALSSYSFH
jgi:hypothetical protein